MPAEALIILVCLSLAIIALAGVSWYQGDMIKQLQRQVKGLEDDQTRRNPGATYTKPIRIVPPGSGGTTATRRELRRTRKVDGE